jgi:NADH:ubiquinone oxidoreductase subunit 6 (subunit J)
VLIFFKNPVYCLFAFIGIVVCFSLFLILYLRLEFIGLSLLIVYIGAILILFLFVIIFLSTEYNRSILYKKELSQKYFFKLKQQIYFFLVVLFLFHFVRFFIDFFYLGDSLNLLFMDYTLMFFCSEGYLLSNDIFYIGIFLYTKGLFYFMLMSFSFFIAMVGSIILILRRK